MSYTPCKFCNEISIKNDGAGNPVCWRRAETGSCEMKEDEAIHSEMFPVTKNKPTGRNKPCPCGSGRSGKNCCL